MKNIESFYSDDKSLLIQVSKPIFNRILKTLPVTLKPNTITLSGFIFVLINCFCIHLGIRGFGFGYILGSVALFIYLLADNIDGMQARKTNQTSKLGGILDQWIDAISLPLIALPLLYSLHVKGFALGLLLCLLTISCFILYIEQHIKGTFYKPAFGPNEFLLLVIIGYVIIYFNFNNYQLFYHPKVLNISSFLVFIAIFLTISLIIRGLFVIGFHIKRFITPLLSYSIVIIYGIARKDLTALDFEILYISIHAVVMVFLIITLPQNQEPVTIILNNTNVFETPLELKVPHE